MLSKAQVFSSQPFPFIGREMDKQVFADLKFGLHDVHPENLIVCSFFHLLFVLLKENLEN